MQEVNNSLANSGKYRHINQLIFLTFILGYKQWQALNYDIIDTFRGIVFYAKS